MKKLLTRLMPVALLVFGFSVSIYIDAHNFFSEQIFKVYSNHFTSGNNFTRAIAKDDLIIIQYNHYTVGYSTKYKIPIWTYYELTADQAWHAVIERKGTFKPDDINKLAQADDDDYSLISDKYDKGHMVPCESMTFDCDAMKETFVYTNCIPQSIKLNRGPWKTLESYINDWAIDNRKVLIFTGNFVSDKSRKVGPNKVYIPDSCFKIVVDYTKPEIKGIAFVFPNITKSLKKPINYIRTIDQVEESLNFDFFIDLSEEDQKKFEAASNSELWVFASNRYKNDIKKNCKAYNDNHKDGNCKCDEKNLFKD
jgi:endonuclease G